MNDLLVDEPAVVLAMRRSHGSRRHATLQSQARHTVCSLVAAQVRPRQWRPWKAFQRADNFDDV
jgi:hypothetical protein